jgi:hypothetical protein
MAEITQHRRLGLTKTAEPKKIKTASIQAISVESETPQQPAR